MAGQNDHSVFSNTSKDADTALFRMLWQLCAGPLVTVPREKELVFYFPQGNIEQVEASNNDVADQEMRLFDLPFKILCRVMDVQLQVEAYTDEVVALVTLIPEENQDENAVEKEPPPPPLPQFHGRSFCKKLTPSDAATHGKLSVLKRDADKCLPPLDMSRQPLRQDLAAKDLRGIEWQFQHVYRAPSQRHLFQCGWSTYASSNKLVAGDTFIFLRGENGELRVGVRRAMRQQGNVPSLDVSRQSMKAGVLQMAHYANRTKTKFTIHYKPRTSPGEFIVPYDQYMESMKNNYSIGMRFGMKFEGEDEKHPVQSYAGTIVGVEDADPNIWKNSKWRCLKVSWDKTSTIPRPERVSPWKIAPAPATSGQPATRGPTSYRATSSRHTPSSQDQSTTIAQLTQELSKLTQKVSQMREESSQLHETIVQMRRLLDQNAIPYNDEHGTSANWLGQNAIPYNDEHGTSANLLSQNAIPYNDEHGTSANLLGQNAIPYNDLSDNNNFMDIGSPEFRSFFESLEGT